MKNVIKVSVIILSMAFALACATSMSSMQSKAKGGACEASCSEAQDKCVAQCAERVDTVVCETACNEGQTKCTSECGQSSPSVY